MSITLGFSAVCETAGAVISHPTVRNSCYEGIYQKMLRKQFLEFATDCATDGPAAVIG